jgi:hypothetical protein
MEKKRLLYVILIVLVFVTGYTLYQSFSQPEEITDLNAYIMVSRYAYSSNPHAMVTLTDEILEDCPILEEAFEVEARSHAFGLAHPIEWVVCSYEDGKAIEELINNLPSIGEGSIRLEYLEVKFQYLIEFGEEPPRIA